MTDLEATLVLSANIRRILAEQGRSANWLTVTLKASPGAIYPIVRGEANPTIGTVSRIAVALGVSIDELLTPQPISIGTKKTSRKLAASA